MCLKRKIILQYSLAEKLVIKSAILNGLQTTQICQELIEQNRNISSYYSNAIDHEGTHPSLIDRYFQGGFSLNSKEKYLQRRSLKYITIQKTIEEDFKEQNSIRITNDLVYDIYHRLFDNFENKNTDDRDSFIWPDHTTEAEKVIYALQAHYFITAYFGKKYRIVSRLILDGLLSTIEGYGLWNISRGLFIHSTEYEEYLNLNEETQEGESWNTCCLSKEVLMTISNSC